VKPPYYAVIFTATQTETYWESLEAIALWKAQKDHQQAQHKGKTTWYSAYSIRICKVEREYHFGK